jgi:cell division septum initiation protein DivIVA
MAMKKYRILGDLMYQGKILAAKTVDTLEALSDDEKKSLIDRKIIIDVDKFVEEAGLKSEADKVIADAKIEASKIIAEAKAKADEILNKANKKEGK